MFEHSVCKHSTVTAQFSHLPLRWQPSCFNEVWPYFLVDIEGRDMWLWNGHKASKTAVWSCDLLFTKSFDVQWSWCHTFYYVLSNWLKGTFSENIHWYGHSIMWPTFWQWKVVQWLQEYTLKILDASIPEIQPSVLKFQPASVGWLSWAPAPAPGGN